MRDPLEVVFDPLAIQEANKNLKVEEHRLSEEEFRVQAVEAS